MTNSANDQWVNARYVLTTVLVVLFTWLIHEFAHWATYAVFGYEATMGLNHVSIAEGFEAERTHRLWCIAMGPIVTVLQAVVAFWILKRGWKKLVYPVLFSAFYMRSLAGAMNVLNPNDEGKLSVEFGLGLFAIPVLVGLFLLVLVILTSRRHHLHASIQWKTTMVVMVTSSMLILGDMIFSPRLIG